MGRAPRAQRIKTRRGLFVKLPAVAGYTGDRGGKNYRLERREGARRRGMAWVIWTSGMASESSRRRVVHHRRAPEAAERPERPERPENLELGPTAMAYISPFTRLLPLPFCTNTHSSLSTQPSASQPGPGPPSLGTASDRCQVCGQDAERQQPARRWGQPRPARIREQHGAARSQVAAVSVICDTKAVDSSVIMRNLKSPNSTPARPLLQAV